MSNLSHPMNILHIREDNILYNSENYSKNLNTKTLQIANYNSQLNIIQETNTSKEIDSTNNLESSNNRGSKDLQSLKKKLETINLDFFKIGFYNINSIKNN